MVKVQLILILMVALVFYLNKPVVEVFNKKAINGLLTFEYGIQNHVLTSLSTIKGAWKNSDKLKKYRRKKFYQESEQLDQKRKI